MSIEEVIALHQNLTYRVYAIGFAPGFAFLGQVDERIAAPRLSTPRLKVPRGAVGIADRQTAIYPGHGFSQGAETGFRFHCRSLQS